MTTSEKPETILAVASAEKRRRAEWLEEFFAAIDTDGEAKDEDFDEGFSEYLKRIRVINVEFDRLTNNAS